MRSVVLVALPLCLSACALDDTYDEAEQSVAAAPPATITVGSLTLTFCNTEYTGYCGQITRPLDPTGVVPGTIDIGFEWYPRTNTNKPALGTILTEEGGPGFSSTGSRDGYVRLFQPLRDRRDIVIIDKRGTGVSGVIDCDTIQTKASYTQAGLTQCANQLGDTADLYGSAPAAGDIVAALDALDVDRVDYYGDSYGTFFGQVFAVLYPNRVRSLILDSAYPITETSAWFPTEWTVAVQSIDLVCSRSPSCAALGGDSLNRIERLLTSLRATPISGRTSDGDGGHINITANAGSLYLAMATAGDGPSLYRDLDAAARAYLDDNDAVPLLRLIGEATSDNENGGDPEDFSEGLYVAVVCQDYPELMNAEDSVAKRKTELAAGIADEEQNASSTFAPFTVDEVVNAPHNTLQMDLCLHWPVPAPAFPQDVPVPVGSQFPSVPTLVMNGDVDTTTSPIEGAETAAEFPNSTYVELANQTHEVAIGDEGYSVAPKGADTFHCASKIALNFVQTLEPGDTSCASQVRATRTVPKFAVTANQLAVPTATAGNTATNAELKAVSSATEALGDAIARWFGATDGEDEGLRGGTFTFTMTDDGYDFVLMKLQFTTDVATSGTVTWNQVTGDITAALTFTAPNNGSGQVTVEWNDLDNNAQATIKGAINGHTVRATRVAP
jgi:pimeloyl-ACP methyl ester carboxylesterase